MNDNSDSIISESTTQYELDFSDQIKLNTFLVQHFEYLYKNTWLVYGLGVHPAIAREKEIPRFIEALIENNVIDDLKRLCQRTYAAVESANGTREQPPAQVREC